MLHRFFAAGVLLLFACHSAVPVARQQPSHWLERRKPGTGSLYLDAVPSNLLLHNQASAPANKAFACFLIGMTDSTGQNSQQSEANLYWEYRFMNDWTAFVNGDSLHPVFSLPKTSLNLREKEQIVVFEIAKGEQIDSLCYADSFGAWDIQTFTLNRP